VQHQQQHQQQQQQQQQCMFRSFSARSKFHSVLVMLAASALKQRAHFQLCN
jgi:hypothetical protein